MKPEVILVVGVPSAGKSWIAAQKEIADKFNYVHHDGYIGHINQPLKYVEGIAEAAKKSDKPILAEAPFSISAIKGPLETRGFKVTCVFIIERPETLRARWGARPENQGKQIPIGHLSRQTTYAQRAKESGAFAGTSKEVFEHLRGMDV